MVMKRMLTLCSRLGFNIGKLVRLSYSTSPDFLIHVSGQSSQMSGLYEGRGLEWSCKGG